MTEAAPPVILIVDDDPGLLRLLSRTLEREGFTTATAGSGLAAARWLESESAELMLLDLKLEDMEGTELIEALQRSGKCPPFVIITGQGDERVAVDMMKRGAADYLVKDEDFLQFVPAVVRRVIGQIQRERRLEQAEQQVNLVRSVVEQGFSAVLIADADLPDPKVLYINPAFTRLTGCVPDAVIGQRFSSIQPLQTLHAHLVSCVREGTGFIEKISSLATTTGERWGEWRLGPVQNRAGRITNWLVILRDITERKQLEKEVLEISDRERHRIGQDLHDGLSQHLAGIELMSQVLQQKLAPRHKSAAAGVGEIAGHVRDAITQARALARGLSPVTLETEGLGSALQELAHTAENLFGIRCRLQTEARVPAVHSRVAIHLYRIAQEAVSNAVKHGKASEVNIIIALHGDQFVLKITDDGAGFPEPLPDRRGMGLRIMQYRAGMVSGTIAFETSPAGGAVVTCSAPLHEITSQN